MNCSSQHHSFDILLATRYGIEEAILIHHLQHWIRINRAHGRNIIDGKCWTYQTQKEIAAHFPYLNEEKVKYAMENLEKLGIILRDNHNKLKFDKTVWYAFVDEQAFGVDEGTSKILYERENSLSIGKIPDRGGKIPEPIPDTKISNTKTTTTTREREGASPPPPSPSSDKKIFEKGQVKIPHDKLQDLLDDYGTFLVKKYLDNLCDYAESNPTKFKQYSCHAATIRRWMRRDNCLELNHELTPPVIRSMPKEEYFKNNSKHDKNPDQKMPFLVKCSASNTYVYVENNQEEAKKNGETV